MSARTQFASAEFRGVSDITAKSVYGSALKVKKTNMQSRGKLFPLLLLREFELYMFDRVEQKLLGSVFRVNIRSRGNCVRDKRNLYLHIRQ